jgi:hypothetical protein
MIYTIIRKILREAQEIDREKFLSRLQSIATLANRPGTEGEKQAALAALQRMKDTAKSSHLPADFLARMDRIIDSAGKEAPKAKPTGAGAGTASAPREPNFKVGSWVKNTVKPMGKYDTGKVLRIKLQTIMGALKEYFAEIELPDGTKIDWRAIHCRRATQDEIDSALSAKAKHAAGNSRKPPPKNMFSIGDWVVGTRSLRVGKVTDILIKKVMNADQYVYHVDFVMDDGSYQKQDYVTENVLRVAKHNEISIAVARQKIYAAREAEKRAKEDSRHQSRADAEDREWREQKRKQREEEEDKKKNSSTAGEWRILGFAKFQEDNSDKIYGYATNGKNAITFWGRRDGPYSVKVHDNVFAASTQYQSKIKKGYVISSPSVAVKRLFDEAVAKTF